MIKKIISIYIILYACILNAQAQEEGLNARDYFLDGFYKDALKGYLKILRNDPANIEANRKIGVCYLNINGDRSRAIDHLEFARKNDKKHGNDEELLLDLAAAYHYAYRFDDAINLYKEIRAKTNPKNYTFIDRQIEICNNAKKLTAKPIDVTFINLGKEVNSTEDDYYPFVTKDESFLVFTTRRKGTTGNLTGIGGLYTSDIYFSQVQNGKWTKAKSIGPQINTMEDEQCVGLSSDGSQLMIYQETPTVLGDIYYSTRNKGKYTKPVNLSPTINTKDMETEAYIMPEGTTMYFISNRPGGVGKADIYVSHKLPDGTWGMPVNLGNIINTPEDEAFPRVTDDGKTLYFASKGHNTMGGFDIFKSTWNEETNSWNTPVNIGYPINTPEDNMVFSLCANERDAYVSMYRKEDSIGELDIYKVVFNTVEQRQTAVKGCVTFEGIETKEYLANITIFDGNEIVLEKNVNPKNGKYVVSLVPGTYTFVVESEGYPKIEETVKILDLSDYKPVIEKNFVFVKPQSVPENATKNKTKPTAENSKSQAPAKK
jgi:hypothetical protein